MSDKNYNYVISLMAAQLIINSLRFVMERNGSDFGVIVFSLLGFLPPLMAIFSIRKDA